jgi:prolyl-tRNA editing enzyme YbaK/EbsC (Cys-tRNA(Pro) deacylase)
MDLGPRFGVLDPEPALGRPDLLAPPVLTALEAGGYGDDVLVAEIDPLLADTAAFCERYGVAPDVSANCVVVTGRRGEVTRHAACVVLATMRVDVNGFVRRHLDARKASFAAMEQAVAATAMEYGGITPIGLPDSWPVLVHTAVVAEAHVVVGSGVRRSKVILPGALLTRLPGVEVHGGVAVDGA